mmetsp:Transcript_24197/g.78863  ORF Transcript_24197/g.78863 Transcript_24197/m.78863 type:complete len:291 (-) Transcript_24197:117-989(-)
MAAHPRLTVANIGTFPRIAITHIAWRLSSTRPSEMLTTADPVVAPPMMAACGCDRCSTATTSSTTPNERPFPRMTKTPHPPSMSPASASTPLICSSSSMCGSNVSMLTCVSASGKLPSVRHVALSSDAEMLSSSAPAPSPQPPACRYGCPIAPTKWHSRGSSRAHASTSLALTEPAAKRNPSEGRALSTPASLSLRATPRSAAAPLLPGASCIDARYGLSFWYSATSSVISFDTQAIFAKSTAESWASTSRIRSGPSTSSSPSGCSVSSMVGVYDRRSQIRRWFYLAQTR